MTHAPTQHEAIPPVATAVVTRPSPRRRPIVWCGVLLLMGLLATATCYWMYYSSEGYRLSLQQGLSQRLRMHVEIGKVRPRGLRSRELSNTRVFLSEGGLEVFRAASAVWTVAGLERTLDLRDGWVLVGTADWSPREYQRLLASGLGHDFAALSLSEVRLSNIDIRFRHGSADFQANGASGAVRFDDKGQGEAALSCKKLNGADVSEPVDITVRFKPGPANRPTFQEVRLRVPFIPISVLGLDRVLSHPVESGRFSGAITYRPDGAHQRIEIVGALRKAALEELTTRIPGGPIRGSVDLQINSVELLDGRLQNLDVQGHLHVIDLQRLLPWSAAAQPHGALELQLDECRVESGRIVRLSGSGRCAEVPLDRASRWFGKGQITGSAHLELRSLSIVDDSLRSAEAIADAEPAPGRPGLIHRELLSAIASNWLGVDPSSVLPETVEYTRLGAKFVLDGNQLHVYGTHGPDGRTLATVRLLNRDWPVLREPDRPFEVPDPLPWLRERAKNVDRIKMREWWQQRTTIEE